MENGNIKWGGGVIWKFPKIVFGFSHSGTAVPIRDSRPKMVLPSPFGHSFPVRSFVPVGVFEYTCQYIIKM